MTNIGVEVVSFEQIHVTLFSFIIFETSNDVKTKVVGIGVATAVKSKSQV